MPMLNQDFTLYKDSHFNVRFNFGTDNISGSTAIWAMIDSSNNEILVKKSSDLELLIFSNEVLLPLVPSDTVDLIPRAYKHELRITDADGYTAPVSIGTVDLKKSITLSAY